MDLNSNARFDDAMSFGTYSDGRLSPGMSDMIFVDPKSGQGGSAYGYDVTTNDDQQPVGKLVNIDGRFYDMKISPAGDKLTLTPSSAPAGYVSNPNKGYRALVHGDQGIVKVSWNESGKSPLPAGKWQLLSYTIDRTAKPDAKKEEEPSLLKTLSTALVLSSSSARPSWTLISARAKKDYAAVTVREGETADLPFGPPYQPIVKVSGISTRSGAPTASLKMSLVGAGGEVCSNLVVDGGRPEQPQFTIVGPEGKQAAQGKFRYG